MNHASDYGYSIQGQPPASAEPLGRPVECSDCPWTGTEGHVVDLRDGRSKGTNAGPTPPAGGCPECGHPAYLVRE